MGLFGVAVFLHLIFLEEEVVSIMMPIEDAVLAEALFEAVE